MVAPCMASVSKANVCAGRVGWGLIVRDGMPRGLNPMPVQTIAAVRMLLDPTVNLGCVCLTSAFVILVLVAPAAMKSCRCGARTIVLTVVCAPMGNVFVI